MYTFIVEWFFWELEVVLACMLKNFMAFAILSILNNWKIYFHKQKDRSNITLLMLFADFCWLTQHFEVAQQHVEMIHSPLVALQSSGQILTLSALASGGYLHEVATAVATLMTTLACMEAVRTNEFSELLSGISPLLPQGLETTNKEGIEHVVELPEGSSPDCLVLGV